VLKVQNRLQYNTQWRQRDCNFGGDGSKRQSQRRQGADAENEEECPVFIGVRRWPYSERRESQQSLSVEQLD